MPNDSGLDGGELGAAHRREAGEHQVGDFGIGLAQDQVAGRRAAGRRRRPPRRRPPRRGASLLAAVAATSASRQKVRRSMPGIFAERRRDAAGDDQPVERLDADQRDRGVDRGHRALAAEERGVGQAQHLGAQHRILRERLADLARVDVGVVQRGDELLDDARDGRQLDLAGGDVVDEVGALHDLADRLGRRRAAKLGRQRERRDVGGASFFDGLHRFAALLAARCLVSHRHLRAATARIVLAAPERPAAFARGPLDQLDAAARAGRPPPLALEGDAQQRFLLLRLACGDQAQQAVDVVQADAVAGGELARVGAEVGGRHELAAGDAVLGHHAAQLAHFLDADLPAHPLLALDDARRRVALGVVLE